MGNQSTSIYSVDDISSLRNGAAIIRRLQWLDDRLFWHGGFRRNDMVARFTISPQQASADIAQYQGIAPSNARLDSATKAYVRVDGYVPMFPKDAFAWMRQAAEVRDHSVLPCESLAMPARRVDSDVMGVLMAGYETRTATVIEYQSLSSEAPSRRVICPHHVVDTGDRVHVRAWDDRRRIFTDFVVGRMLSAQPEPSYPWVDEVADVQWNETIPVRLAPHPGLSDTQRRVVEHEHGMRNGCVAITVRKALVVYLLDRLGLLGAVRDGSGIPDVARGIRCLNPEDVTAFTP